MVSEGEKTLTAVACVVCFSRSLSSAAGIPNTNIYVNLKGGNHFCPSELNSRKTLGLTRFHAFIAFSKHLLRSAPLYSRGRGKNADKSKNHMACTFQKVIY